MAEWLPILGWRDVLDVGLVATFGWLVIRALQRTRARAAIAGLALLAGIYFVALGLELRLTEALFQGFFAVLVVVLAIVFQEDLRRGFEQLGSWRRGRPRASEGSETLDLLVRAVARLANTRTGALIVLPGREPLDRHVEGGVAVGGRVSEPLLLSLFDPGSPGHDGAVLLRGPLVERFALHLPLSANHAALGAGGTRHAAGLGLAERCDATCIVVSEERGTVSVARDGQLRVLERPEDLLPELRGAVSEPTVRRASGGRAGLEAALAVVAALVLWAVFVPGSDVSELTVGVPVEVTDLPKDLELETIDPAEIEVTLRGLRRDLALVQRTSLSVRVDAQLARLGRRTFSVSSQDVRRPGVLTVVALAPQKVKLSLVPVVAVKPPAPD